MERYREQKQAIIALAERITPSQDAMDSVHRKMIEAEEATPDDPDLVIKTMVLHLFEGVFVRHWIK